MLILPSDWPKSVVIPPKDCENLIEKNLNLHYKMHTMNSESQFSYKCPIKNCHSSFDRQGHLDTHLRVHNNDFNDCQYCPYRYTKPDHYKIHLKVPGCTFTSLEDRDGPYHTV